MGTSLVPIHLLTIIIQSNVVNEGTGNTVRAPVTFDFFVPEIHPDSRAASSAQDLRAQVTLLTVHQISDVVRIFHPAAGIYWIVNVFLPFVFLVGVRDAVRNVLAHPAQLLFACLAFLSNC